MSSHFSMIRHVSYLTRQLEEDLMLRDLIASTYTSRDDVPRYYPIKRSRLGVSPVKDAYWQISEMKTGIDLSDPLPISMPPMPDGLEHAYQEGLKAMGAHYSGPTIKFRRYKPLDEAPIPLGYVPLEKEGLTFNDTEVCRHQYNMILKAMEQSVNTGVGFVDMLEGIKEIGDKKDFSPNWGKVNS